jgi:hypothetical protein
MHVTEIALKKNIILKCIAIHYENVYPFCLIYWYLMPTLSSISAISWHSVLRPEDMKNCVCISNIEQSNLKFPQNILNKMGIHFHSNKSINQF